MKTEPGHYHYLASVGTQESINSYDQDYEDEEERNSFDEQQGNVYREEDYLSEEEDAADEALSHSQFEGYLVHAVDPTESNAQSKVSLDQANASDPSNKLPESSVLEQCRALVDKMEGVFDDYKASVAEVAKLKSMLPKILKFHGSSYHVQDFLSDMERYFTLMGSISGTQKITIASEYMTGEAKEWFLDNIDGGKVETYREFEQLLRMRFYSDEMKRKYFRKLRRFNCKDNLQEYVEGFNELMTEIGYEFSPKVQLMFFTDGLPYEVFVAVDKEGFQTLEEAVEFVSGLPELGAGKRKRKDDDVRTRKRSRYSGCFVCKEKDHRWEECPVRSYAREKPIVDS